MFHFGHPSKNTPEPKLPIFFVPSWCHSFVLKEGQMFVFFQILNIALWEIGILGQIWKIEVYHFGYPSTYTWTQTPHFLPSWCQSFALKEGQTLCSDTQHCVVGNTCTRNSQVETLCCLIHLTLKAPRKNASEKWCLLKSSAANNCLTLLTKLSIDANRVDTDQTAPKGADPDQTAPKGAVWSGSTLFVIEAS